MGRKNMVGNSIRQRIEEILAHFPEKRWYRGFTHFEQLVATILS
jgi:hypothetical protein